jgi:HEAT repeat protein
VFNNFHIEFRSFWLGFLSGVLTLAIVLRLRVMLPDFISWMKKGFQSLHLRMTRTTEHRLRKDIIQHTQQWHLAASLFSLDEVVIEPRLMYPILRADVSQEEIYLDITSEVFPHMAEWPELASCYGAPTFSMAGALTGGANIVIVGQPGSGKSTALAYLACQLARKAFSEGLLNHRLPLFVHVLDLQVNRHFNEIHEPITEALNSYTSPLTQPRLDRLVRSYLRAGQAILIIDGLDGLTREEASETLAWLSKLLNKYPDLQVVTATRAFDTFGLEQLKFQTLAISAWDDESINQFFDRWATLWQQHITPLQTLTPEVVDPLILAGWLKTQAGTVSPFEATLKAWAVFSGDSCSGDLASLMDWFVHRLTANTSNGYRALEQMAAHIILQERSYVPIDGLRAQSREFETMIPRQTLRSTEPAQNVIENKHSSLNPKSTKTSGLVSSGSQLITLFVNQGILICHQHSQIRFNHINFLTYLAGHAFAADESVTLLLGQLSWFGKWLTLGFAGRYSDLSEVVENLLSKSKDDILASDLFEMARWVPITLKSSPWRANILRAVTSLVHQQPFTDGLAARALCALATSGDSSVTMIFRQWLKSDKNDFRRLGVLGCGFMKDTKAVPGIAQLLADPDQRVGKSACLALASIGNKAALDAMLETLTHGNEDMRRAAAEALVNHRSDGLRILMESVADEDLLVRRSVVFGFLRSGEPETIKILEKMVIDDKQWVVRNAASNALEVLRNPNPYLPKPFPPITDLPWLIRYAGKSGIGVQPGIPAQELICAAIESGDEQEKVLALDYVRMQGGEYAVRHIYKAYQNGNEPIRQAAYEALNALYASRGGLPPISQLEPGAERASKSEA